MKIQIKNVQHHPRMSEETECFSASLYVDGVKIGQISNRGTGGCDEFHGDRVKFKEADDWCKANLPKWKSLFDGSENETDLEMYLDELLNDHLMLKDLRRQMRKKILFFENGQMMEVSYKGTTRLTDRHFAAFKAKRPGVEILNELTNEEVLKRVKAHNDEDEKEAA